MEKKISLCLPAGTYPPPTATKHSMAVSVETMQLQRALTLNSILEQKDLALPKLLGTSGEQAVRDFEPTSQLS